jgi:hypothetical protein
VAQLVDDFVSMQPHRGIVRINTVPKMVVFDTAYDGSLNRFDHSDERIVICAACCS